MVCGGVTYILGEEVVEVEEEEDNTTTHPHMDRAVNPRHTIPIPTTITTRPKCLKIWANWTPGAEVSPHQI